MEQEVIDGLLKVLQIVGFPAFFACWLLYRTDKRLDKIIELLIELKGAHHDHDS